MSVCRRQIILVNTAPHRDRLIIGLAISVFIVVMREDRRIRPYLPSFRRIPARIMDPATGASTWAFGSHRCRVYSGIFVMKARIVIIHHRIDRLFSGVIRSHDILYVERLVGEEYMSIKLVSSGSDAVRVYKIR